MTVLSYRSTAAKPVSSTPTHVYRIPGMAKVRLSAAIVCAGVQDTSYEKPEGRLRWALRLEVRAMKIPATSLAVVGLGVLATVLGLRKLKGHMGAGIIGFGLAHVVLGLLDALRTTAKD
jgi:hypothetical protein